MADLPENLQVIKVEPPGTPEKSNIKERLNLHVKRRLQQEIPEPPPNNAPGPTKRNKAAPVQPKEIQKQRKPYQKRVEKIKVDSAKCKKTQAASPSTELEAFDETADQEASPETAEVKNISRDRFKNADILNIVLSAKKRALMQNAEVQTFWSDILKALKR